MGKIENAWREKEPLLKSVQGQHFSKGDCYYGRGQSVIWAKVIGMGIVMLSQKALRAFFRGYITNARLESLKGMDVEPFIEKEE